MPCTQTKTNDMDEGEQADICTLKIYLFLLVAAAAAAVTSTTTTTNTITATKIKRCALTPSLPQTWQNFRYIRCRTPKVAYSMPCAH